MLTISNSRCSRRGFLKVGGLGLGGLALNQLLAAQESASSSTVTRKSVIFLFQHGGPSQFETFDPKMTAPDGVRSALGEIQTTLPGITFGPTMRRLAQLAHKMAIIRSYVPGDAGHNAKPIVHRDTLNANVGSIYTRVAGLNHPVTGMPTNALLYPAAVVPVEQQPPQNLGNFSATGNLGSAYAPFMPGGDTNLQQDMRLSVPQQRLDDRRLLLSRLDSLRREIDSADAFETMDRHTQQAFDVILRGVADSFDLSRESPHLIDRYDTARLMSIDSIDRKWNNHRRYANHVRSIGKLCLLARRLVEAGCGFVTINTDFVWDMHADRNNATIPEGMNYVGAPFDYAVSTLIEDLEARGLTDRVLLVACGEMGRTPRINNRGGRDHWGNIGPLLLYGGGLRMGQVIGRSTSDGGRPASEPVRIPNLVSTIMHTLLDVGQVRLMRGIGNDIARVITESEPIRRLM